MSRPSTVLIVDDDPSLLQTLELMVRGANMKPRTAQTGEEALEICKHNPVDMVLLDVQLPGLNGIEVLGRLREQHPDVGVIMLSVVKEIPIAVEAIKLGALDYLTKDFSPTELQTRILKCLEQLRAARELVWLRDEMASRHQKNMVVGASKAMSEVVSVAGRVADKPATVLITGESGTGKEVLARHIHTRSPRAAGPFVAVNLAAIPSELVESTLFGHERGSFTGATRQAFGKFELADGGTLFLDEIGELKLDVQAKLLRALQEREIERVGGTRPIPLDIRIISATNRPLPKLVELGQFREDLYWRLKVVPIEIPPLRQRREDLPELAQHFLTKLAATYGKPVQRLTPNALAILGRYSWPGNIRELENLVERLVVVTDSPEIDAQELPLEFRVASDLQEDQTPEANLRSAVAAFERSYLRKVLQQAGWNRKQAAEHLGMGYSTLKAKLRVYGIADGDTEVEEEV